MSLPEFEAILKEVVNAKRLSASKMANLTDLTMKNMEHDTQLVSILYRTHKSLPTATAKISSLYVFDALSRAAKHHATKHGLSGDAYTHPGNSASFLFKVGGVVEGLFQDMVTYGSMETKEKTKKILDIWVKGSTFPPEVLAQLAGILKGSQQVSGVENSTPPAIVPQAQPIQVAQPAIQAVHSPAPLDPRTSASVGYHPFQMPAAATPPAPIADPQAALLALLTQAAANNNTMNIPPLQSNATIHAGVPQLAVLQQLAHTAVSVPSVPQFLPPTDRVNIQNTPSSSGVNGSAHSPPSYRNEPRVMVKSEQRYNGYRSPESEARPESRFDERDNMRGRPYRGGFRGRGRGDRGFGRNWDQHDRDYYRNSERDQSPTYSGRGGRSRSRSPPSRYRDGKVSRFTSPPRRSMAASPPTRRSTPSGKPQPEPGKDEFGRDIRPESPKSPVTTQEPPVQPDPHKSPVQPLQPPSDPRPPLAATTSTNHEPLSSVAPSVHPNIPPAKPIAPVSNIADKQTGMESFNIATFDLTSPASWEALGKMWHVTNGYLPSTEELMTFVMPMFAANAGGIAQATPSATGMNNHESPKATIPTGPARGFGRGRGTFGRGRGGGVYGHAHGRQNEAPWGYNDYSQTDAIVLGGGNMDSNDKMQQSPTNYVQDHDTAVPVTSDEQGSGQGGGRMQRVGDKWVFVRGTNGEAS